MENQKVIKVMQQQEGGWEKNQHVHGSLKHEQKRFEKKRVCGKTLVCIIVHTAYRKGCMTIIEIFYNIADCKTAALKEEQSVLLRY